MTVRTEKERERRQKERERERRQKARETKKNGIRQP